MSPRDYSPADRALMGLDQALRTVFGRPRVTERANPAEPYAEVDLGEDERRHIGALIRVDHTGEVCAQALYQGQALTARLPTVRGEMQRAAAEEVDHLVWCERRLRELDSHTSVLNPAWYGLSFALGAIAGAIGDDVSLGFVAATEERVCKHLKDHLERLPEDDRKSQLILQQMLEDEERHGRKALEAGGRDFPRGVKDAMTAISTVMTGSSYRL